MSTGSAARRDARKDFLPGMAKPRYRYVDAYYRGCYDEEWIKLEKEAAEDLENDRLKSLEPPTLEERVEALEEQVRILGNQLRARV